MHSEIFSGKYHVQREIARGGMGTVYLAVDQTLHREVAIKLPHPQLSSDPKFARKFLREAQRMAQMNHENVIRIYEIEEDKGVHFIVMEYFPGQDLKQLLQERGPLELPLALRIAISVTQGLAYAHKRDLIHRDIKPGNVLLDSQFNVKIVDFGIAAALGESSATMTSTLLGTPEYMSPEQVQGVQLTPSSDLYSLGMVLYEMVTGTTPYKGLPFQTILVKLAAENFEPEFVFPAHVPSSLQFLVRGLTKKNLRDRLQDTSVVLETLRGYQHQADFISTPGHVLDTHVAQSIETLALDTPSPTPERTPRDTTLVVEQNVQRTPLFRQSPPSPPSHFATAVKPSMVAGTTSGQEALDVSESFNDDASIIKLDDERQPLATSSWILLSFAMILIVGVSGYLWFRTSFDAPVSVPPVVDDGSADAEQPLSKSHVSIEKAKQTIEKMVSLRNDTRDLEQQVSSHDMKFSAAAQQLLDQLKMVEAPVSVSAGQAQRSERARSREVISQNWQVLVRDRTSEFSQFSESSERLTREFDSISKEIKSFSSASLPPAMRDTLERKQNELFVGRRNVLSRMTRATERWQQYVNRMDKAVSLPEAQPAVRAELDVILTKFREAYQRQDLVLLEDITNMSEGRARMLRGLFRYWSSFSVKLDVRLTTPESATVVVTLENLIDRKGRPISRERERILGTQHLTIHKQGQKWGKLEW